MIKKPLLLFALIASSFIIKAQDSLDIELHFRHIEGFKTIEVGGGLTRFGAYAETGYAHYLKKNFIFSAKFNYEQGKIELSNLKNYNLYAQFNHTVLKLKEFGFLNLNYGAIASIATSENTYLNKKDSWFDYGVLAGINTEIFIMDRLALLLGFNEKYMFADKFGKFQFQAGAGVRVFVQ